jgi:hypothetical protein
LLNVGVRLCVRRQRSQFWPILTRFLDYYSPYWGPEAISIVVEPQGVLTCWSSTLAVLADSGPFHGLLLTVLGSQSDFHGCRTPRCAYESVINNHSLGRFWPVSWTTTLFWGPGVISMIEEPRGVFTCRSSTLTYLADSSPFHAVLLPERFPRLTNPGVRLCVRHQHSQFCQF